MSNCAAARLINPPTITQPNVARPIIDQINEIEQQKQNSYRVILFNDDFHSFDEVVLQVQKATGFSLEKAEAIMWEAHTTGQSIVYCGDLEPCQKVAAILEQIWLRVSVEQ